LIFFFFLSCFNFSFFIIFAARWFYF